MSIIGFDPPRALSCARRVLRLIAFAAFGSLLGGLLLAFIDPSGSGMAIAGISLTVFILHRRRHQDRELTGGALAHEATGTGKAPAV